MNYKQTIKQLRKVYKLTQQDVANKLGITKQAYYRYEKGSRNISIVVLEKLLLLYNYKIVIIKEKEVYDNEHIQKSITSKSQVAITTT